MSAADLGHTEGTNTSPSSPLPPQLIRELTKNPIFTPISGNTFSCNIFDLADFLTSEIEKAATAAYDQGWEDCERRTPVPLIDAIQFRQEQYGWNDTKMAAMLDMSKPHYSEFRHGKRGLPINSIRKAYAIGIPASVLLQEQLTDLAASDPKPSQSPANPQTEYSN